MKATIKFVQKLEWSTNKGKQCAQCSGRKPGVFRDKSMGEGHKSDCPYVAMNKEIALHVAHA